LWQQVPPLQQSAPGLQQSSPPLVATTTFDTSIVRADCFSSFFFIGQESLSLQQSLPIEHLPSLQQSAIPQHESPFSVEAVLSLFCLCIGQEETAVLSPVAFVLLKANAEAKSPKTNITDSAIKILFLIFLSP
jgi:hypothetical protein